jgi:hypothetical protein
MVRHGNQDTRSRRSPQGSEGPTLLKGYLEKRLSQAIFPLAGFGATLPERAAIIGIRLSGVRLALIGSSAHAMR